MNKLYQLKRKIINLFVNITRFLLSPDGNKIAYAAFDVHMNKYL